MLRSLLIVLALLFINLAGSAKDLPDSIVMNVAGKNISLSEFLFIAKKNGAIDLSDNKSLKEYVKLFKNFKLKVVDAEARGFNKTQSFEKELRDYQSQLYASYFSDQKAEEQAARLIYDRGKEVLEFSQIVYYLPTNTLSKDTLAVYKKAFAMYERLNKGEDIDVIGREIMKDKHICERHCHDVACSVEECDHEQLVTYQYRHRFKPLQDRKAFEEIVYAMPAGTLSKPFRSPRGYHIVKLHKRILDPGTICVAHILILKDSVKNKNNEALRLAESICVQAKSGTDFAELARKYSMDKYAEKGGVFPEFGIGEMDICFEQSAYALKEPGEVSDVIKSALGYHIIKLIERKPRSLFDKQKISLLQVMKKDEHNFEVYRGFDERLKQKQGYVFCPNAYAELEALCDEHFPTDTAFYMKAKCMKKPLLYLNNKEHLQDEFAYYLQRCPFSTKTYARDFMREIYDLFVRDLITINKRNAFSEAHPEYDFLIQEYRDGILLFEVSNQEVWKKPIEKQTLLEAEWIEKLNEKYPVLINWKLLDRVRKNNQKR